MRLLLPAGSEEQLLETAGRHNDGGFLARPEWRQEVRRFLEGAIRAARMRQGGDSEADPPPR
jgi:alkanesulfonate monooxygenase SsuD/methylene tetrahydromethanopterin reductase-like flavin-dependent oxidoreductase (luciferase family)